MAYAGFCGPAKAHARFPSDETMQRGRGIVRSRVGSVVSTAVLAERDVRSESCRMTSPLIADPLKSKLASHKKVISGIKEATLQDVRHGGRWSKQGSLVSSPSRNGSCWTSDPGLASSGTGSQPQSCADSILCASFPSAKASSTLRPSHSLRSPPSITLSEAPTSMQYRHCRTTQSSHRTRR